MDDGRKIEGVGMLTKWPKATPELLKRRWRFHYADPRNGTVDGVFVQIDGTDSAGFIRDGKAPWYPTMLGRGDRFEPIPDDATPVEDIDDKIDDWHEGKTGVSLSEHLGMTREEYAAFVVAPPPPASPAVDAVVLPRMAEICSEVAAILGVPPEGVPDAVRRLLDPVPELEVLREADEKARYVDDALDALEEWASAGYPGTKPRSAR